jgi:hypothetical protein
MVCLFSRRGEISMVDTAYFLDLLGDSHHGLGRFEAALEGRSRRPRRPALAAGFA